MTRAPDPGPGPTQSEVLRERVGQVPWRRALVDVVNERLGRGPTAIPDRIEGAVYGQLIAEARATGLVDPSAGARVADDVRSGGPGTIDGEALTTSLALALELSPRPAEAIVAAVLGHPREPASADPRAVDRDVLALRALVIARLVRGERDRGAALRSAQRDLERVAPEAGRAGHDPAFRSGWDAFAAASDLPGAMQAAAGAGRRVGPAVAMIGGSLAGAYWGAGAMPPSWRRDLTGSAEARALADRVIEAEPTGAEGRRWSTSTSSPLAVDPVELAGVVQGATIQGATAQGAAARPPTLLGITALPGRRYVAYHTGAHWRDLETDAARLRGLGYRALLLLVEDRELARCRVTGIDEVLEAHGIELIRYPIRDPLVPRDGPSFRLTVATVLDRVREGRSVAVACRGGFDRSGMATACVLREGGLDATTAIARVHAARARALRLPDQQAYVRAWPPDR
jgi:hypothetical protein